MTRAEETELEAQTILTLTHAEIDVLNLLDMLERDAQTDRRWLAIARTHIQIGFMAADRARFSRPSSPLFEPVKPSRVEDGPPRVA